jgi:dipeptidase E
MNLLLLSSSRVDNTAYLEHAENHIKQHLGTNITEVLFVPYAGIAVGFDQYQQMVEKAFGKFGYQLKSLHQFTDLIQAVNNAQAIVVGGGNTFCLLKSLQDNQLIEAITKKVKQGTPYIGWSAGSNIATPSIRTTNDMPIVEPKSFNALNLVPFQINPHYIDGNPPGHNGETREMRLNEFLVINPNSKIVGIPEGTGLKISNNKLTYLGDKQGYLFDKLNGKRPITDTNLSFLLSE